MNIDKISGINFYSYTNVMTGATEVPQLIIFSFRLFINIVWILVCLHFAVRS